MNDKHGSQVYSSHCLDVLSWVDCDVVVSDPPYPMHESYGWKVPDLHLWPERITSKRGIYFWHGDVFPLPFTARHVWAKANRNRGIYGEQYEVFYEVNGSKCGLVMRHAVIDSDMNATLNGDVFLPHPCQKPIRLMRRIIAMTSGLVLDPFMGSGTTLRAAKDLGRKAIGVEREERYCEIAAQRLSQGALFGNNGDVQGATSLTAATPNGQTESLFDAT